MAHKLLPSSGPIRETAMSVHITQYAVPTPTLPPADSTNTYVIRLGRRAILVDAGSKDRELLDTLVRHIDALGVSEVVALVATHYHRDHTQGLPYLQSVFQCPILVHELDLASAIREMGLPDDAPGVQPLPFDMQLSEASQEPSEPALKVLFEHLPGHTHGHVHIYVPADEAVLVGDHLSGMGTVWIGPPDGHMEQYYRTLEALMSKRAVAAGPGHGAPIPDAAAAAREMLLRRLQREEQIAACIAEQPLTSEELVAQIYGSALNPGAFFVAKRTVQAHLQRMLEQGLIKRRFTPANRFVYNKR